MTTPTSSTEPRTRLAGRDFLYALRSPKTWLIPIVFCLLSGIGSSLLFWLPLQTMDTEAKAEIVQNFTYLLSASSLDATFFFPSVYDAYGVFLFFGMLAAFAAFDFCFSKTKSSAFLSFALRRETLYVNRLAAGGIWFVVGILLIQICTLITQYAFGFPITADLIVMLSFTFLLLFLESLLGLMIGGLAVAVCHNVPEGIFTAVCTAAAPYALVRLFGTAAELLLPEVVVPLYDCTDLLAPVDGTYDEEEPEPLLTDGLEAVVLSVDTMPVLYPEETLLTEDEEDSDEPVPLVPFEEPVLTEVRLAVEELVPMPLRFTGVRVVPSVLTLEL